MPVRADLDFEQPDLPIQKTADHHYNANLAVGRYHKTQTLGFKNGNRIQKHPLIQAIGGTKTVQDLQLAQPDAKNEDEFTWKGSLGWNEGIAAGQSRPKSAPAFRPRYCFLDKKVLRFFAYFQEVAGLDDRAPEKRIRHVHILYHLEDDSISILEPRTNNSGLFQGMLLKRHRIPKREPIHGDRAFWHWTDLAIGSIADIYSKKYHICSSDEFTRKYLESEGINLDDNVPAPPDPYLQNRLESNKKQPMQRLFAKKEKDVRQYLRNDRKVLRFYAVSELPYYPLGCKGEQKYVIHYYLSDDTLEVRELRSLEEPKGAGTFPKFLKRQKVPKGPAARPKSQLDFPSALEHDASDFYGPLDFTVGSTIEILQKRMVIYDCDDFTYDFYKHQFEVEMQRDMSIYALLSKPKPESTLVKPPPHTITSVGTPEDSLQNCLHLQPKAPKRDLRKLLSYAGKNVRFEAKMRSTRPEENGRRFVITYHLADDTMTIFEPYIPNCGRMSSRFLIKSKVAKIQPKVDGEPDYFTIDDFYIGCILRIHGFEFEITGADERVRKYLEHVDHPIPKHTEASLRQYFYGQRE